MRAEEQGAGCFYLTNGSARGAREGADEGRRTGCRLLLLDEMLVVQLVTSRRVAHTVVVIAALPSGLIFMRRSLHGIGSKRQVIGYYTALPAVADTHI
jgi:hypothetical protein